MKEYIYLVYPYIVGYLFAIIFGQLFIKEIMKELKRKIKTYLFKNEDIGIAYGWYAHKVGYIEEILYITSLLLKHPEFIAAWLAFKIVGRWATPELEKEERKELLERDKVTLEQKLVFNNAEYNIFTIGNALSIIYALSGWKIILWLQSFQVIKALLLGIVVIVGSFIFNKAAQCQTRRLKKIFPSNTGNNSQKTVESAALKRKIGIYLLLVAVIVLLFINKIYVMELQRLLICCAFGLFGLGGRALVYYGLLKETEKKQLGKNEIKDCVLAYFLYYPMGLMAVVSIIFAVSYENLISMDFGVFCLVSFFLFSSLGFAAKEAMDRFLFKTN